MTVLKAVPPKPRPRAKRSDPLISALIATLPPDGAQWPVDRQKAWLKLMAHALSTKYGGDVSAVMGDEALRTFSPESEVVIREATKNPEPPAKPKPEELYNFFIDHAGLARRKGGARVYPHEVTETLFDIRGDGDPDAFTVFWADGSQGLLAAPSNLVISAVNP